MRSLLAFVAVLLALSSSQAFSPLPNSLSPAVTESSTAVYFFGAKKQTNDKKQAKNGKKVAEKDEKKKEPFVFLIGKPQYDWGKGRVLNPGENKKRMNWLYKEGDGNRK